VNDKIEETIWVYNYWYHGADWFLFFLYWQKKYTSIISEAGGKIVSENPWGLKSLAYPIQKKTTGLYWVMEFIAPADFNEKLKIQLLRDESVLRHLLTKLDKYAVEYNEKKRKGVPTGNEKAVEA